MKRHILILATFLSFSCYAQNEIKYLTKSDIKNDLSLLDQVLQNKSSYLGLNGYEYQKDIDEFLGQIDKKQFTKYDFGLFLSKTIGKIGDRHSYIKDYELHDSLYFPIAFSPYQNKILVVNYIEEKKEYQFWNSEFPYLKSINNIHIEKLLSQVLPRETLAPKASYFTNAVRELRDIESVFRTLGLELLNPISLKLTNDKGDDKEVLVELVKAKQKAKYWDERFYNSAFGLKEQQFNDKSIIEKFFTLENNIGYIKISDMIEKESCPVFFDYLDNFMTRAKQSDALIIDVRDNGGGTRDLIQELAGYFIHRDSIYVVNTTKQRAKSPINKELKKGLHNRFLFSKPELDIKEQQAIDKFMVSFKPMYDLDSKKFSQYHYYILNGQKLTKNKFHYRQPIYILANERTFSAASVLVSVFKGLPNIKIVGVNTDGSSGNSENFKLPNSELRGKISTMVSYQKNGKILDGIGTEPDITIERSLNQIFLREDYQLKKLIEIIKQK